MPSGPSVMATLSGSGSPLPSRGCVLVGGPVRLFPGNAIADLPATAAPQPDPSTFRRAHFLASFPELTLPSDSAERTMLDWGWSLCWASHPQSDSQPCVHCVSVNVGHVGRMAGGGAGVGVPPPRKTCWLRSGFPSPSRPSPHPAPSHAASSARLDRMFF